MRFAMNERRDDCTEATFGRPVRCLFCLPPPIVAPIGVLKRNQLLQGPTRYFHLQGVINDVTSTMQV